MYMLRCGLTCILEKARSMVCARCWRHLVDTPKYEDLCKIAHMTVKYKISLAYVGESARLGCSWCKLIETTMRLRMRVNVEEQEEVEIRLTNWSSSSIKSRKPHPDCLRIHTPMDPVGLKLVVFTLAEDVAASHVCARPVQLDVSVETIKYRITSWLSTCSTHACCAKIRDCLLPTRLIEVSPSADSEHARVVHSFGRKGQYATLSYCWGAPSSSILTSETYHEYHDRMPWPDLPQTIKDAIMVTRAANIQYLWVDAFCILQDVESDKIHEIAQMCDIYRNSVLTIVSASAKDASEGFLQQRLYSGPTFTIPFRIAHSSYGVALLQDVDDHLDWVNSDPIQTRAWTLQEQVLAQRVLYFGSRSLEWRCGAGRQDLDPDSVYVQPSLDLRQRYLKHEGDLLVQMRGALRRSPEAVLEFWHDLVTNYHPRKTTFEGDKLRALAGIAQMISTSIGPSYYAGLWQWNLPRQLCWYRIAYMQGVRTKEYCAPSWSWASCTGHYHFAKASLLPQVRIIHIECTLVSEELTYGAVKHGFMVAAGKYAWGDLTLQKEYYQVALRVQGSWDQSTYNEELGSHNSRRITGYEEHKEPQQVAHVSLDAVEDKIPRKVMCLGMGSDSFAYAGVVSYEGLVLAPVPSQSDTFRRIGYFWMNHSKQGFKFWRETTLRIV